jgi:glycine cleavage system H protein
VGITDFAQDQLGDVVFVQLPKPGARVEIGAEFGVIESVKSASDLFSPLSGEVIEVNTSLDEQPELVNDSPYDAGWMLRIRSESPAQLDTLMDSTAYRRHIGA